MIIIASLKRRLVTLRRHPSLVQDLLRGKNWQVIEDRADTLDEREVSEFLKRMKKTDGHEVVIDRNAKLNLNKLCHLEDFRNVEIIQALTEIHKLNPMGLIHRKDWEWAMGLIAMQRLGKLNKRCSAVGVGSGTEVIPFYLANKIDHVYATDLYNAGSWSAAAPTNFLENPKKYAPFPYREEGLTVMRMDGTKLEFPSESFDIAFSFSSIEHFGGKNHSGSLRSLKEIERVLKPGGIAVIATEFIINNKNHYEFFNRNTLFSDLLNKVDLLKLVTPIDFGVSAETLDTLLDFFRIDMNWNKFDDEFKRKHPLIVLRARNIVFTSIMLVFSKLERV